MQKSKGGSVKAGKFHQSIIKDRQDRQSWWLGKGFPLIWFAFAAFVVFGQTIRFNYTYLDDHNLILNNMEHLKSAYYLPKAFSEDVFHFQDLKGYYYRPVLTLSFMTDAVIGNGSFAMFHFSNIVYHILATFMLFMFFVEAGFDRPRSLLFSLIFLAHPMVTQAVSWVPGRNDSLLAIFVLGSFIFWLKYLKTNNIYHIVHHLLFYFLALFTKENAVVLPFLILIYSIVMLKTPLKKWGIAATGWVIITLFWVVIRYQALGSSGGVSFLAQVFSIIRNLTAILPFLGKTFFPFDLSVFPILADMKISTILGIVSIGVITVLVALSKPKRWFLYFFGIIWFLAFLVPSFVSIGSQIPNFSEHRSYLSVAGILFFVMESSPVLKANFSKIVPVLITAGIILLFSVLTLFHIRNFRDQFAFWQNAVDTSPSHAFNYNNLGGMYFMNGDLVKAEPCFRKALQINPKEPIANSNLGLVCVYTDRPAEAEKFYLEEIRVNPDYDHVHYNLGLLYFNHGRSDDGIREMEKTLAINPFHADACKTLMFTYENLNRRNDYERIRALASEKNRIP